MSPSPSLQNQIYDPKSITIEKIRAVEKTNLVESVEDEYESYKQDSDLQKEYQQIKPTLNKRKSEIYEQINHEPSDIKSLQTFFQDTELLANLKSNNNFNIDYLNHHYYITYEKLENYYIYAKFKYECGIYDEAEVMLGNYILIVQSISSHQLIHYQAALWGRLACRILQAKWNDAIADLTLVKESIEVRNVQPLDQLRQRGWLMHWSLFVYLFQHNGIESLIDLYSERYYQQTIENLCPWLLRYYIIAIILAPNKRSKLLKDILNMIKSLKYLYNDSMTEFLYSLFDSFDFNIATIKLIECSTLIKNDFFLKVHYDKFMHEARMLICEMYCTVHRTIDLTMLAEKLQFSNEEAEKWMVDMVRGNNGTGTSLNAKIDSFGKQVIIAPPVSTSHQQVIDATKELTTRTSVLSNNLENLIKEQAFFLLHRAKEA